MSIFERFRDHSILVVGDVMLDKYVHGQVRRISPEAPIQILNVGARRSVLGGAGNVAKNVNDLGCHVTLVGVVGADEMADEFMETAGNICIDLIIDPTRPTTTKTRFVADNHQLLRVDDEVTKPISPEVEQMLIEAVHDSLSDVDVVVLSDYAKGVLTDTVLAAIMEMAKGKTIIVDPKRPSFTVYRGATIITPNEWELRAGTGITDLDEAAEKAMAASDAEAIVVTRSEKGVSLFRSNEPPVHIPAVTRDVADVSGAGDTLVAVLAACLAAQMDLPDALTIANRAAGVAVSNAAQRQ